MRVFAAIPLPKPIAKELERWAITHRANLPFRKWTHPNDYHITLQFLGDTPMERIESLNAALSRIQAEPMSFSLSGAGTFGAPKAPRVLWAAVSGDMMGLNSLHDAIIEATRTLGYVPEDRPYAPHITIARGFADGGNLSTEVITSAPAGAEWKADRFVLMRTHMNHSPMYEEIGSYPLCLL